jgi:hypothetical protein
MDGRFDQHFVELFAASPPNERTDEKLGKWLA